jgi:hypothetical protein
MADIGGRNPSKSRTPECWQADLLQCCVNDIRIGLGVVRIVGRRLGLNEFVGSAYAQQGMQLVFSRRAGAPPGLSKIEGSNTI